MVQQEDPQAGAADERWIALAKAGRTRGFEQLFETYAGLVRDVARRFVCDPGEADDVVQEVFLKAFRGIVSYRAEACFSTWLYSIAVNACRDYAKKQARSRLVHSEEAPEARDPREPFEELSSREQSARIEAALARLLPDERLLLLLKARGLAYDALASSLGISPEQVRGRLYRARKKLRGLLGR